MTKDELIEFMAARSASPHVARLDVSALQCYGCAHSAAMQPPPSGPSGERPCVSCVRNPDRVSWSERRKEEGSTFKVTMDDDGHAHVFDPDLSTMYNGAPRLFDPMDNYVTLDQRDQEDWLRKHPEYERSVRPDGSGGLRVIRG